MKKFLQKIFKYKAGRYALYILFHMFFLPTMFLGKIIYFISKPLRALGLFLMGEIHSAKEELTDWRVNINLKDFF